MSFLRISIITLIVLINFILQSTFSHYFEIFSISPNTEIVIIVSFAILKYEIDGAIIGFFIGLLHDIIWCEHIGLYSSLYMIIGYFSGNRFKSFYRENYIIPIILVFFASIFYNIIYYIITFLFKDKFNLFYCLKTIILPETFYNIAITTLLYKIIYIINKYIEKIEEPRRRLF